MSTTPPAVVESDGFTFESSKSSASDMIRALTPEDPKGDAPREVTKGKEKDPVSEAASTLGKKGGAATAKARKAADKEPVKEAPDTAVEPQKAAETKAGDAEGDNDDTETDERKSRAAERVKQATREAAELKRESARLRAENDELRRARPSEAVREPSRAREATPQVADKPKPDQFESYEEYLDARDAHNRKTWEAEHEEKQRVHSERQEVVKTVKTFQEAAREAVEADPEFWDKVPEIHDTTPLGQEIVRTGAHAPAILRYLADNEDVYKRLSTSSDLREVIREVGKIEARIEGATAGNPPETERPGSNPEISKARPPARPVAVSPRIASAEPDENSSLDEHIAFYDSKEREARKRRSA